MMFRNRRLLRRVRADVGGLLVSDRDILLGVLDVREDGVPV